MSVVKRVALPFPYTGVVHLRGGRCQRRRLHGWTLGDIPVVEADEAPVVLEARGVRISRTARPQDVAWRSWRGAQWRPVLDEVGVPQTVGVEEFFAEPPLSDRTRRWKDHPCGLRLGVRFVEGPDARAYWPMETAEFLPRSDRVVGDNRAEVEAVVSDLASEEMAEIDGVLHKRALPPMWSLGWDTDIVAYNGTVALVVPDFGGLPPPSLGLVPATRPGVARELASRLVQDAREHVVRQRPEVGLRVDSPFEGEAQRLGTVPENEAIGWALVHAMAMLGRSIGAAGDSPAGTVRAAFVDVAAEVGRLELALGSGDLQFFARGQAYAALDRARDALVDAGGLPRGMVSILRTALDCGRLCGDRAAEAVEDDEVLGPAP